MNNTCSKCGHNPMNTRAALRRSLAICDDCGTYCEKCLEQMAIECGGLSVRDAAEIRERYGAAGFMRTCEESGETLCPLCFEKE